MPWTEAGFRSSFAKDIKRLEAQGLVGSGLTFHGLRHSVATDLREIGFDNRTITDMLGQKTESMTAQYNRQADLSDKMKGVIHKLVKPNEIRTKVSRKSGKNV